MTKGFDLVAGAPHQTGRRRFLQGTLAALALGGGLLPGTTRLARAAGFAPVSQPILANLMLNGGPDMRHPFVPPFSRLAGSVGRTYWEARAAIHNPANPTLDAMEARWHDDYVVAEHQGTVFGILRGCDWLADQWEAGHVALMCGTLSDTSRDHDQAIRNMEMGVRDADKLWFGSGWGGRLANAADGNSIALTRSPRRFVFGPDPLAPTNLQKIDQRRVIAAADLREFGLPDVDNGSGFGLREYVTRGLKHYYAARRPTVGPSSVHHQFFEHERKLREFGEIVRARLAEVPVPPSLEALFGEQGVRYDLALQTRNLFDALACNDLLGTRVASLEFNGWDTHDRQRAEIEPNLFNLFGRQGALAGLYAALPPDAARNLTLVIGGEFGRQLKANGSNGTDHGSGTVIILIGEQVRGGVYGTMFPEEEIARITRSSADIEGRNAIDHVFGAVCEWLAPGSQGQVFPDFATAPLEPGLDLSQLFAGR